MKRIMLIFAALTLLLCACGSEKAPAAQTEAQTYPKLETNCITVYGCGESESWDITDPMAIQVIAGAADVDQWEAQTDPGDQLSAVPSYALDFNNGTALALLGDGYILLGTGVSASEDTMTIQDGVQYYVGQAFTKQVEAVLDLPESEGFSVDLQTDRITVYTPQGEPYDITDTQVLKNLEVRFNIEDWPTPTELEGIPTEILYALDCQNGTCIGWLGGGYFLVGTEVFTLEDGSSLGIVNGDLYQMDTEMAGEIEELLVG